MVASEKNIVILGGSYGGVSTAHSALKHIIPQLPDKNTYQVVLVSASSQVMCRPACPRALISDDMFPQDRLFVSIQKSFEQYPKPSFRFLHGTATELDHTNRAVSVSIAGGNSTEKISYCALVIATGASTVSPLHGFTSDFEFLRASWATFRRGLSSAKSIVVAGGGPAGVETAGELGEYLNGRAGILSAKLDNPKVAITVVNAGKEILPVLRPALAKKAEDLLAKVGVTVINNVRVESVSPQGAGVDSSLLATKTSVTLSNGETLEADLYIPATGTTPNTGFIDKSLLAVDGRVDTNATTLRVDKAGERVYAVGDVGSYARPAIHAILEAVPVVTGNLKRDLLLAAGKEESSVPKEREFKEDTRESQLVPIGKSKGVGAAMGYQLPSWAVWMIKGRDYWLWTTGDLWSGKHWAKES
ncbi:hypothetical protein AJ80_09609 [Polytolypa hystricis UAMH7299]|uniref:FAD/NAD(P)-binding domain-containing protein n=1 Tax=Polytolypa hystricis (strain UAMH7299) TaxID=1447883 RepID=A0A2B7WNC5_POLH7|nr:hypothetical protein AJ80_09609 [Polytolypa hystricis UAMH7299]